MLPPAWTRGKGWKEIKLADGRGSARERFLIIDADAPRRSSSRGKGTLAPSSVRSLPSGSDLRDTVVSTWSRGTPRPLSAPRKELEDVHRQESSSPRYAFLPFDSPRETFVYKNTISVSYARYKLSSRFRARGSSEIRGSLDRDRENDHNVGSKMGEGGGCNENIV